MENLFNNGPKQMNIEGNLSNTNSFKNMVDNVVMGQSQMGQRLENFQRPTNYSDFLMENQFNDLNLRKIQSDQVNRNMMNMNNMKNMNNMNTNMNNVYQPEQNNINMSKNINMNNNLYIPQMGMPQMGGQIHPMLLQFNNNLMKEQDKLKEDKEKTEENQNGNDVFKDIIEIMENHGQYDERYNKSEFLNFVKKLNNKEMQLNEKENTVTENYNEKISNFDESTKQSELQSENHHELDDIWNKIQKESQSSSENKLESLFSKENPFLSEENKKVDLVELAKKYIAELQTEKAKQCLEAELQQNPENSEAYTLLGKIFSELDRDDLTMMCLSRALSVDPYNTEALHQLGISCTNEFDEFEAMQNLRNWVKMHPEYNRFYDSKNPMLDYEHIINENKKDNIGEDYYEKALKIEDMKQKFYKEVLNLMENIAIKFRDDTELWTALGIGHFIPHNNERATECFRMAVNINPKDYNAWNKIGDILAHSKLNEEALRSYQKALDLKPDYVRCWANLGIAYSNLDRFDDSITCYLKALKIFPDITHVWSYLNSALIAANKSELCGLSYSKNLDELCKVFNIK